MPNASCGRVAAMSSFGVTGAASGPRGIASAAGFVIWLLGSSGFGADGVDLFARDVAPLLVARCLECHGDAQPAGGLALLDEPGLRAGGESGPAVVAGRSAESLLWQRVAADEMPPTRPLAPEEKAALARWIDSGAAWAGGPLDPFARSTSSRAGRDFWSLQPLRDVTPPDPAATGAAVAPGHPIDAFIGRRLAEAGLRPAPVADPRTLLRRLCFDLVGLPPTPAELESFAADPSEAAYLRIVDRLLASPAHAERWARHWLDVVRYGESDGFERNVARDNAWHYRDWVIGALAADMPYDEFVRMQLLGDQLAGGSDGAAATGFWVAGVHNTVVGSSPRMRQLARQDEIEDVLATVGQTFVGLTFHCARCHDHKFDPVSQREYYQLAAAISGLGFGERDVAVGGPPPAAGEPPAAPATVRIYTLVAGPGEPTRVLHRGDPDLAGERVSPGTSAAIAGLAADFGLPDDAPEAERRRRLADWITHADNPLFLRVIVNRVWHHHFGVGLVDTPSDFGFNGGRPSHPELLDWLAGEFRRHGLRLSWLHRLIVTSHAYRQASRPHQTSSGGPAGVAVDADNRLVWRGPSRRLEAEAVRDAMLAVSGRLDDRRGGPGFRDVSVNLNNGTTYYDPIDAADEDVFRRTIYRFTPRGSRGPLLETFDCPDPSATAPRRSVTVTPLQSLALLNDAFVLRMAEAFAGRVAADVGGDVPRQVTRAWWLALGRDPDGEERRLAEALVAGHGLPALCRGLFNLTEFVVID
jgi:hypothetical protein